VLVFAGFVVWQMNRRLVSVPHYEQAPQQRQIATIKDDWDRPILQIEQEPHETFEQFMFRVNMQAARIAQREQALLLPGEVRR
jgi:hypothetical protein